MLIYRQMHYRDFYGKTVQLEFIVPMSRTRKRPARRATANPASAT